MRIIKKLLIYTTIIGALLFSILVVFGFLYQDSIVASVQKELNKHLNAEIKVGTIDLSFISNFPLVSVTLNNVVGYEAKGFQTESDTLFKFSNFELSFNIMEVVNGNYLLNEIEAQNGFLNLEINKKGSENYLIFLTNPEDTSSFTLNLQKVKLIDVVVGFNDLRDSDQYEIHFVNTIAKGDFSDTQINTALYGTVVVNHLELMKTQYLTNEKAQVDVGLSINLESGSFQITRGFLTLRERYTFEVKGKTNAQLFHYTFDAKGLKIKNARSLVPNIHLQFLNDYEIDGDLNVFLEVKRKSNAKHPEITGNFSVSAGDFTYKVTGESVKINEAKGSFDLGKYAQLKTTRIDISKFSLVTTQANAQGKFSITNLVNPRFSMKTQGKADLFEISKLADLGENFGMQGLANFDIEVKGRVMDFDSITHSDIRTFIGKADIALSSAIFRIQGLPAIENVNSKIQLNQEVAVFTNFSALVAQSNTTANAKLHNWLDYVLKKSKRLNISGDVTTQMFDVDDWSGEEQAIKTDFSLPEFLAFEGNVKMGTFRNKETIVENLQTHVKYLPKSVTLSNTYFDVFGGRVLTNLTMKEWANGFAFVGDVTTKELDVSECMKTYGNFGMTSVTYQQIKGDLHSNLDFSFTTDKQFNVKSPSLVMDGDLMLLKGEINENELLYNIPKEIESNKVIALFVNLELFEKRLHHIKFDTISNHLTVKNKIVSIPRMSIKSTALNIQIQGTHTFGNEMDYYMNFNLNNVLGKKAPIKDEYGYIEDDADGNRNMYLHVYTHKGEVHVDVDKLGAKKLLSIKNSDELNVAKSILKEEMGLFKNDTTVVIEKKQETFEYDLDMGEFSDSSDIDSAAVKKGDTLTSDSTILEKILKKKKKKKKEDNFEEWDVEDDDF